MSVRDLLQVAARSGSGSAARALGGGLAGMRTTTRRAILVGGTVAFLVYLGWDLVAGINGPTPGGSREIPVATSIPSPSPTGPLGAETVQDTRRVTYAIKVSDIAGLAPNTPAGTMIDLWVTWDRPITEVPRLQRLLRRVLIEQVAPPVTPDGPYVAMLSVREPQVDDLLWADRYGALGATILPSHF